METEINKTGHVDPDTMKNFAKFFGEQMPSNKTSGSKFLGVKPKTQVGGGDQPRTGKSASTNRQGVGNNFGNRLPIPDRESVATTYTAAVREKGKSGIRDSSSSEELINTSDEIDVIEEGNEKESRYITSNFIADMCKDFEE